MGRLKVNFSRFFESFDNERNSRRFQVCSNSFLRGNFSSGSVRWYDVGEIAVRFNLKQLRNVNNPSLLLHFIGLSDVIRWRSSAINIRVMACNVSEAINLLLLHSLTQLIWCTQSTVQAPISSLSLAKLTEWNGLLTWYRRANARLILWDRRAAKMRKGRAAKESPSVLC